MKIQDLKGNILKKELNLTFSRKTFENKHVDGSGNFGFVLEAGGLWFSLLGFYNPEKDIYSLEISRYLYEKPVRLNPDNLKSVIEGIRAYIDKAIKEEIKEVLNKVAN